MMTTTLMGRELLALLLISLCSLLVTGDGSNEAMEKAKKCAEDLPALYEKLCAKVKNDGEKVVAIKKKCIQYPETLKRQTVSRLASLFSSLLFSHLASRLSSLSVVPDPQA